MIKLRRHAALLAGFFFVHLAIAVGGAACVMPSSNGQTMGVRAASPASMAGMSTGDTRSSSSRSGKHSPCDGPGLPGDCNTVASCNQAVLPAGARQSVGTMTIGSDHARLAVLTPHSRSNSPEPPPPRA